MCLSPVRLPDGTEVWCRNCERCRRSRVNDWVGRCIAESRYADTTHSVTLTYGTDEKGNEDHIHSAMLIYQDVQNYFKRLRKNGYKFKYLVSGEYGKQKRRAHWHVIIFWKGDHPCVQLYDKTWWGHQEYWQHGHTYWEPMTPESIWYVCKYLQKDQSDDEAEAMLRPSKKPPLGHEYFQEWAKEHVRLGVAPRSYHYTFHDVKHKDGKRREFYMTGVTAENFVRAYLREFIEQKGHARYPDSPMVDEWLDKQFAIEKENEHWKGSHNGEEIKIENQKAALREEAILHGGIDHWLSWGTTKGHAFAARCKDNTLIGIEEYQESFIQATARIVGANVQI